MGIKARMVSFGHQKLTRSTLVTCLIKCEQLRILSHWEQ